MGVSRAWLYVRGPESVRIVIDGETVAVYGPGARFSATECPDPLAAVLCHAAIEHDLVQDGWTLETLTTERRFDGAPTRRSGKRGMLHLVATARA